MNHCFPSTPFLLNQEFGTGYEALGWTAGEWAVTQDAVWWGVDTLTHVKGSCVSMDIFHSLVDMR